MWDKLKRLFRKQQEPPKSSNQLLWFRRPGAPEPTEHGIEPPPPPFEYEMPPEWRETKDQAPPLRWVEAADTRFGVRYLDVRPFSHCMTSTIADPAQFDKYVAGRSSTGEQHRGTDPDDPRRLDCALIYPFDGKRSDGALVRSMMLEDKWDVFLWDGVLYFARSWTGTLVHRARIEFAPGRVVLSEVVSPAAASQADETFPLREVDFLLRALLYQQLLPHPLPRGFPDQPDIIARYSFSQYGRWAYFATYEDMRARDRPVT